MQPRSASPVPRGKAVASLWRWAGRQSQSEPRHRLLSGPYPVPAGRTHPASLKKLSFALHLELIRLGEHDSLPMRLRITCFSHTATTHADKLMGWEMLPLNSLELE